MKASSLVVSAVLIMSLLGSVVGYLSVDEKHSMAKTFEKFEDYLKKAESVSSYEDIRDYKIFIKFCRQFVEGTQDAAEKKELQIVLDYLNKLEWAPTSCSESAAQVLVDLREVIYESDLYVPIMDNVIRKAREQNYRRCWEY